MAVGKKVVICTFLLFMLFLPTLYCAIWNVDITRK